MDQIERNFDSRVRDYETAPGIIANLLVSVLDAMHVYDEPLQFLDSVTCREAVEQLGCYVVIVDAKYLQVTQTVQVCHWHLNKTIRVWVLFHGSHVQGLEGGGLVFSQQGQQHIGVVPQVLETAHGQVLEAARILDDGLQ